MDQQAVIQIVLAVLIPILVAVLKAYNWQPTAAVWIKFAFSIVASLAVMFFLGTFAGFTLPSPNDPIAFLAFFGDWLAKVFALAVIIYQIINQKVTNFVLVRRGLSK